jgi:hypothetical protein
VCRKVSKLQTSSILALVVSERERASPPLPTGHCTVHRTRNTNKARLGCLTQSPVLSLCESQGGIAQYRTRNTNKARLGCLPQSPVLSLCESQGPSSRPGRASNRAVGRGAVKICRAWRVRDDVSVGSFALCVRIALK